MRQKFRPLTKAVQRRSGRVNGYGGKAFMEYVFFYFFSPKVPRLDDTRMPKGGLLQSVGAATLKDFEPARLFIANLVCRVDLLVLQGWTAG